MLYQLNYIHHLWDDKGSAFFGKSPNFFFLIEQPAQPSLLCHLSATFSATFSAATDATDSQVIMQGDPPRNEGDQLL